LKLVQKIPHTISKFTPRQLPFHSAKKNEPLDWNSGYPESRITELVLLRSSGNYPKGHGRPRTDEGGDLQRQGRTLQVQSLGSSGNRGRYKTRTCIRAYTKLASEAGVNGKRAAGIPECGYDRRRLPWRAMGNEGSAGLQGFAARQTVRRRDLLQALVMGANEVTGMRKRWMPRAVAHYAEGSCRRPLRLN